MGEAGEANTRELEASVKPETTSGAAVEAAGQNVPGGAQTETQGGGGGTTAGSVIKDMFESGLGVVPLVGGLLGLFGGGSSSPPPLTKYQMPSSIAFMSADTGDQLSAADYDQMGAPRVYDSGQSEGPAGSTSGAGATANGAPQITVNVQAMDAQSFLDRSSDIANAVRNAMLNMSSINDVVNDL